MLPHETSLSGTIPTELARLSLLSKLNLGRYRLNGTIPATIGTMSSLVELSLTDSRLGGSVPPEICALLESDPPLTFDIDCDLVSCTCRSGCPC